MFSEIRTRLTMQYIVVMAVFLLLFIVVSFSGVLWALYREEQRDIRAFAEEEAREHIPMLRQDDRIAINRGHDTNASGGKLFNYVYDRDGQLVAAEFPDTQIAAKVEKTLSNWKAPDGAAKLKRFTRANGEKAIFIICGTRILDEGTDLGRAYVAEDITSYYEMLKVMLGILAVLAILFLLGAAYLGYFLAGKAMVPIKQSFLRQREFAADASHELRTPLSVLLTSVDAVQLDHGNTLTTFSTQTLADMKSEIRRMSRIVADLLTLVRADAGATNIIKEEFDLHAVAEQITRSLQPLADQNGIRLELESQEDLMVFADKERISQLLVILMDNALKYTSSGGKVKVMAEKVLGKKPSFVITVIDTGVGIAEEHKGRIFERFYRIDKARSREAGGTGLGLSIAKWIVEAHGGTIRVESTPGKGSAFQVRVPNEWKAE